MGPAARGNETFAAAVHQLYGGRMPQWQMGTVPLSFEGVALPADYAPLPAPAGWSSPPPRVGWPDAPPPPPATG